MSAPDAQILTEAGLGQQGVCGHLHSAQGATQACDCLLWLGFRSRWPAACFEAVEGLLRPQGLCPCFPKECPIQLEVLHGLLDPLGALLCSQEEPVCEVKKNQVRFCFSAQGEKEADCFPLTGGG